MVGVLGSSPSVDTRDKWLIFSHFLFCLNLDTLNLGDFWGILDLEVSEIMLIFAADFY